MSTGATGRAGAEAVFDSSASEVLRKVQEALEGQFVPTATLASKARLGVELSHGAGRELWVDDPLAGQVLVGLVRSGEQGYRLELRDVGAAPALEAVTVGDLHLRVLPPRVIAHPELLADVLVTTRDELSAWKRRRKRRPGASVTSQASRAFP